MEILVDCFDTQDIKYVRKINNLVYKRWKYWWIVVTHRISNYVRKVNNQAYKGCTYWWIIQDWNTFFICHQLSLHDYFTVNNQYSVTELILFQF